MAGKLKTIASGSRFGRLAVSGIGEPRHAKNGDKQATSIVVCDCGMTKTVRNNALKSGHTKSCGCIHVGWVETHGLRKSSEYRSWQAMIGRATRPSNNQYGNYGGRGITICWQWRNSFEVFMEDMGPKPSPKHSIDRINNEIGYCKDNCRWATRVEQGSNKRNNRLVTFYNKTMTVAGWSRISQISQSTISERINRGWTEKEAVWTPVKRRVSCAKNRT